MEFKNYNEYLNDNNPQVVIDMGEMGKIELVTELTSYEDVITSFTS